MTTQSSSRAEARRRTQSRILSAAKKLFAELGYDRATIRAIAAEAGTDPALVMRYFGSKDNLFDQVAALDDDPPVTGTPEQAAEQLLAALETKLTEPPIDALAAIRSMFGNPDATGQVRAALGSRQHLTAGHLAPDDAELRAGLLAALTLGTVIGRYLLQLDALADAEPERITALLRGAFHHIAHGTTQASPPPQPSTAEPA